VAAPPNLRGSFLQCLGTVLANPGPSLRAIGAKEIPAGAQVCATGCKGPPATLVENDRANVELVILEARGSIS